ncbi:MAG: hypothetical protein WKF80_01000 [Thermomicrobiales bacterium]
MDDMVIDGFQRRMAAYPLDARQTTERMARYLVEHRPRQSGVPAVRYPFGLMAPIVSRLREVGADGELVVVDTESSRVIVRWPLDD